METDGSGIAFTFRDAHGMAGSGAHGMCMEAQNYSKKCAQIRRKNAVFDVFGCLKGCVFQGF
jgi:hypothetical protein